jgi:uncharacterized protein (TIGR03435 family)
MRRASLFAGVAGLFLFAPNPVRSQTPAKLEFEVASVRASSPRNGREGFSGTRSGGPGTTDPGRITYSNQPLNLILADAFDVNWDQISGPDRIGVDRYDIVAKVPEGTTKEQARQMLQNLLLERFRLAFHMQTKSVQGYELTVGPGGSKLKESVADAPEAAPQPGVAFGVDKDGFPILPPGVHQGVRQSNGHVYTRFADTSVAEFVKVLASIPSAASMVKLSDHESRGAPTTVLDKTGLTGSYDFTFDYAGSRLFAANALPAIMSAVKSSLEKQLGLKLVDAKVPVSALVIDSIEKSPTEN